MDLSELVQKIDDALAAARSVFGSEKIGYGPITFDCHVGQEGVSYYARAGSRDGHGSTPAAAAASLLESLGAAIARETTRAAEKAAVGSAASARVTEALLAVTRAA